MLCPSRAISLYPTYPTGKTRGTSDVPTISNYIVVLYNYYRECVCVSVRVVHPVVITCDSNPHLKQQHCDGIAAASRSGHQGLAETCLAAPHEGSETFHDGA